jgi:hypothetical protein
MDKHQAKHEILHAFKAVGLALAYLILLLSPSRIPVEARWPK